MKIARVGRFAPLALMSCLALGCGDSVDDFNPAERGYEPFTGAPRSSGGAPPSGGGVGGGGGAGTDGATDGAGQEVVGSGTADTELIAGVQGPGVGGGSGVGTGRGTGEGVSGAAGLGADGVGRGTGNIPFVPPGGLSGIGGTDVGTGRGTGAGVPGGAGLGASGTGEDFGTNGPSGEASGNLGRIGDDQDGLADFFIIVVGGFGANDDGDPFD